MTNFFVKLIRPWNGLWSELVDSYGAFKMTHSLNGFSSRFCCPECEKIATLEYYTFTSDFKLQYLPISSAYFETVVHSMILACLKSLVYSLLNTLLLSVNCLFMPISLNRGQWNHPFRFLTHYLPITLCSACCLCPIVLLVLSKFKSHLKKISMNNSCKLRKKY